MLATMGLIFAIALLVVMIIKGIDMICATVITAVIILLSSQLSLSDGLLTTFSGGAGGFVTSWFLILGMGGIFGQLVLETGLATKIAKWLTQKLGARMVGLVILICTFFITLLGINGYIMVFVKIRWTADCFRLCCWAAELLPMDLCIPWISVMSFPADIWERHWDRRRSYPWYLPRLWLCVILYISTMPRPRATRSIRMRSCWPCIPAPIRL